MQIQSKLMKYSTHTCMFYTKCYVIIENSLSKFELSIDMMNLASVPFFERFSVQILESATAGKGVMSKKVKLAWFQSKINYIDRIFYLSRVVEYV